MPPATSSSSIEDLGPAQHTVEDLGPAEHQIEDLGPVSVSQTAKLRLAGGMGQEKIGKATTPFVPGPVADMTNEALLDAWHGLNRVNVPGAIMDIPKTLAHPTEDTETTRAITGVMGPAGAAFKPLTAPYELAGSMAAGGLGASPKTQAQVGGAIGQVMPFVLGGAAGIEAAKAPKSAPEGAWEANGGKANLAASEIAPMAPEAIQAKLAAPVVEDLGPATPPPAGFVPEAAAPIPPPTAAEVASGRRVYAIRLDGRVYEAPENANTHAAPFYDMVTDVRSKNPALAKDIDTGVVAPEYGSVNTATGEFESYGTRTRNREPATSSPMTLTDIEGRNPGWSSRARLPRDEAPKQRPYIDEPKKAKASVDPIIQAKLDQQKAAAEAGPLQLRGLGTEQVSTEPAPPKEAFDKGLARKNKFLSTGGYHGQNQVMAAEPEVSHLFRSAANAGPSGRAGVAIARKQIEKQLGKGTWQMFKDTLTQEQIEGQKLKISEAEQGTPGLFDKPFQDHLDAETYQKNLADPRYKAAGDIWDANAGKDITEAHVANEGRMLKPEHLGPSKRYFPLSGAIEDEGGLYANKGDFEAPSNPLNRTRTGKGEFDVTDETLGKRVGGAQAANKTAVAIRAAEQAGMIERVKKTSYTDKNGELRVREVTPPKTIQYKGETYKAVRVGDHVMPDFVAKELGPILERKEYSENNTLARQITGVSTWGGPVSMEKVAHYTNQAGVLVTQAPTLGRSALAKTIGNIPVAKTVNAMAQLVKKLPEGTEGTVREMMNNGEWFPRMDKKGELTGMSKVDLKGRLAFREALLRNNPDMTPNELYEASTRFGEYNTKLAPDFQRAIKNSVFAAYDPFITASNAMTRNALGTLKMSSVGGLKAGTKAAIGGSIPAAIGTYVALHRGVTGKLPDPTDENFKLGQIPYGETENGKVKYINVMRVVSPLGNRGLSTAGITAFVNTLSRGGDVGQAINAAEQDVVNRGIHLAAGPPVKFATRMVAGVDPSIRYGGGGDVSTWPAHPPTRPGMESVRANLKSAFVGINPGIENLQKENTEGLSPAEVVLKALGIISTESVQKNRNRLERQRTKWDNKAEEE